MSSIPLAIRTPQNVDPLEQYQRAQGVVGMIQQQRLQQQQIAQNQFDLNDRKAGSDAMHEWDGKDIEDLPGLYIKHGATANAVLSLKNSILDQQTKRATLGKDLLDNDAKRHDNIAGAMNNAVVTNKDGTMNADATAQAVESLGRNQDFIRNLSPDEAQQLPTVIDKFKTQVSTDPDGFQRDWRVAANGHLAESAISANASKQAETASAQATAQKTTADTAKTNLENQTTQQKLDAYKAWSAKPENTGKNVADFDVEQAGAKKGAEKTAELTAEQTAVGAGGVPLTKELQDSKYIGIQMKMRRGQALTDDDKAFAAGYEKQKEVIPQFNITNQVTGGGLGPGAPGQNAAALRPGQNAAPTIDQVPAALRGQVQAVLDIRSPMPPQTRNNPVNTAVRQWVNKLDPQYLEADYPAKNKILQSYVKDASDGQIGAINTALGHLGELDQARKALSQNDIPLLHSLASKVGAATGSDAATTYSMILHRVGPEMTSAYIKGGGGEGERGANEADFAVSKGATQISSNIAESANLLRSKLSSKEKDWTNTFKPHRDEDQFENRFLTPQAKQTLDQLSANAPTNKGKGFHVGQTVSIKGKQVKITAVHPDGSFDAQ